LQPTQIVLGHSEANTGLLKLGYTYGSNDNNGNVLTQTITVPGMTYPLIQTYSYDSLNRIDDANETSNGTQTWRQDFSYDRYGNRNFVEANTSFVGFDKLCNGNTELCSTLRKQLNPGINNASNNRINSGQDYTYDASGNTLTDANGQTFVYDGENKQVKASNGGGTVGEYHYDGDGKRIKKHVPASGETTIFVYDAGGKLIGEYSTIVANSTDAKVNYLTADVLGSPRVNTDATGSVIARHDYHPFGEEITAEGTRSLSGYTGDSVRKQFTAYERDDETNLDYAQARYHTFDLGRMQSPDPFFFQFMMLLDPQRFNLYGYARNSPLKWTDPDGERLHLRGNNDWLKTNVLYGMAGGQEEFDKYFEIKDGQVVARDGVDFSKASVGIQELSGLVSASENYVFFAGTDGGQVADLFEGTRDKKGNMTDAGKRISKEFTCGGNYLSGCGTQVGTSGRASSDQPASLANGDPVFAVIALNSNTVITQVGTSYGILSPVPAEVTSAQEDGKNKIVKPVSYFIHESTENRKFAEQGKGNMDYGKAHAHAIQREATIRKALNIGGGFAGAFLDTRIPKK